MASRDLDFIHEFLQKNWDYVLEKYRDKNRLTVTSKSEPADLLTEVDLTIQKRFADAVAETFPTDLVVGEEGDLGKVPTNPRGRVWVIDPIDGTYNFVRGMNPMFGISIALVVDGLARAAGVAFPIGGQIFLAEQGEGSTCNGRPLRVSDVQHLAEACVEIDFSGAEDKRAFISRASAVIRQSGHRSAARGPRWGASARLPRATWTATCTCRSSPGTMRPRNSSPRRRAPWPRVWTGARCACLTGATAC